MVSVGAHGKPPEHQPVLVEESLSLLAPDRGGCYVDCTLGLGGHTAALLERFPRVRVFGFDRDPKALELATKRLAPFGNRFQPKLARFDELQERLIELGLEKVEGILADFGVSSMQLDFGERGFSFAVDGPLDMRMGKSEITARDIINGYSEEKLTVLFRDYGEERQARRIARSIVEGRLEKPLETTSELCDLIVQAKPRQPPWRSRHGARRGPRPRSIHPATQVFQALRIEVNQELQQIEDLLDQAIEMLDQNGRLVVISYHSLEDRIVKHRLRDLARGAVEPITGRPRAETQIIEVLTKKPIRPTADEVAKNPRSRSARLRAGRRL